LPHLTRTVTVKNDRVETHFTDNCDLQFFKYAQTTINTRVSDAIRALLHADYSIFPFRCDIRYCTPRNLAM